ncbi:MAG: hypothetical protein DHS20C19_06430 [Acidimicrobiales bacterium]|nr:MAG: hypothetical protein DHS20C19_06430 [Acidimicrobiales bacterium]
MVNGWVNGRLNEWRIERAGDPGDFLEAARKVVECAQSDDRLFAVAVLKDRLPDIERDAVEQAIAAGATWARIAESLGCDQTGDLQQVRPAGRADEAALTASDSRGACHGGHDQVRAGALRPGLFRAGP